MNPKKPKVQSSLLAAMKLPMSSTISQVLNSKNIANLHKGTVNKYKRCYLTNHDQDVIEQSTQAFGSIVIEWRYGFFDTWPPNTVNFILKTKYTFFKDFRYK